MTLPSSSKVRLLAHTPDHLRALLGLAGDYEEQFAIRVADGVKEFLASAEVSEAFLERLREAKSPDSWRDGFGIVLAAEERLIGVCSFNGPPDAEGAVEISYAIVPDYSGRGYATEAARLLIAHASGSNQVRMVRAHTLPVAGASTRILEKCGFRNGGEIVDPVDGPVWRWELKNRA